MIRANYTLKLGSFRFFYWTMEDWSADRLSTPNFRKRLPKPHDEISLSPANWYAGRMNSRLAWIGTTHKGYSGMPNHALNFDDCL
jgi:hypothetical protein